jgi:hypothetical protein
MASNLSPLVNQPPTTTRATRLCSICKTPGHDLRKCPQQQRPPTTVATELIEIPVTIHKEAIATAVPPPPMPQPTPHTKKHALIKLPENNRQKCSYCALTGTHSRTRFMCEGCGVPFCSIGSGKTNKDCFSLAHDNQQIREKCIEKYALQQKYTSKKWRPKKRREE